MEVISRKEEDCTGGESVGEGEAWEASSEVVAACSYRRWLPGMWMCPLLLPGSSGHVGRKQDTGRGRGQSGHRLGPVQGSLGSPVSWLSPQLHADCSSLRRHRISAGGEHGCAHKRPRSWHESPEWIRKPTQMLSPSICLPHDLSVPFCGPGGACNVGLDTTVLGGQLLIELVCSCAGMLGLPAQEASQASVKGGEPSDLACAIRGSSSQSSGA